MSLLGAVSLLAAALVLVSIHHASAQGLRRGGGRPARRFNAVMAESQPRLRRPALRRALGRVAQQQQQQQQQLLSYQPQQQLQQVQQRSQQPVEAQYEQPQQQSSTFQTQQVRQLQPQQLPPSQPPPPPPPPPPPTPSPPQLLLRMVDQREPPPQLLRPAETPPQQQQVQRPSQPNRVSSSITFYVFTRYYAQPGILQVGDDNSLQASGFSSRRPTKVLVHGFGSNVNRTMMATIKDAYLYAMDVNVVSVDWSPLSAAPWYPAARSNVDAVGERLAALLDWLATRGALPEQVHVVGHSLGAHVAGVAGANLRSGRLSRISGLDPARPGFRDVDAQRRLDSSDAVLVDVIHTTAGFLGLEQPVGHLDFYPNGGTMSQPGCLPDLGGLCSHEKAYKIFRDSISDVDFSAVRCDSAQDAMQGRCGGRVGVMGERGDNTLPGIYYAVTR